MSCQNNSLRRMSKVLLTALCLQFVAVTAARADGPQPGALPATLYVVIGGSGTCSIPNASRVFPDLQGNDLFRAFESSIVLPGYLGLNDNVIFACYEWVSPMMQFYDFRYQPVMTEIHESQIDELVLKRASGMRRIVIIGHSHGGWRAIKLAASPYLAASISLPMTLISVDPISRVTCQKMRDAGCHEAPRDLSFEELNYLRGRARWLNAYQNNGVILNSGAIAAAHANLPVRANHIAIQSSSTVWQAATGWILTP